MDKCFNFVQHDCFLVQILCHLGVAWDIRWKSSGEIINIYPEKQKIVSEPVIPTVGQVFR